MPDQLRLGEGNIKPHLFLGEQSGHGGVLLSQCQCRGAGRATVGCGPGLWSGPTKT